MSTRVNNPVGPSSSTPDMAVHPAAPGTEVPGPVPDTPAQGPAAPRGSLTGAAGVAAAKAFRAGLVTSTGTFAQCLQSPDAGFTRQGKVSASRIAVTALLCDILRSFPSLAPGNPDDIEADAAFADAMDLVALSLQSLLTEVQDTVRLVRWDVWLRVRAVNIAATHQARTTPGLDVRLAPVKAALSKGKRTDTSVMTSALAGHQATKAQSRAAHAQQRAVAASQSQTRTDQAHAARQISHGTSPVPLANPQGPAASADVAPQGPAPSPVPGTGR